jgi:hypothetical protein
MSHPETIPAVTAEPGQVITWNGVTLTIARVDAKSDGWVVIHPKIGNAVFVAPGGMVNVVGRSA